MPQLLLYIRINELSMTQLAMRSSVQNTFSQQRWSSTIVDLLKLLPGVIRKVEHLVFICDRRSRQNPLHLVYDLMLINVFIVTFLIICS